MNRTAHHMPDARLKSLQNMRVRSVQFLDVYEAQLAAQRLIQGAAVDVYWSAWLLDFRAAFGAGTTAERLLKETRAEVNALAFDNPKDVGGVPEELLRRPGVSVRVIRPEDLRDTPWPLSKFLVRSHHQKYIVVDATAMLVNGVDVDARKRSQFSPEGCSTNEFGCTWAEACLLLTLDEPSQALRAFCAANHRAGGTAPIPPCLGVGNVGLVNSEGNREYLLLRQEVSRARELIVLESQYVWALTPLRASIIDYVLRRLSEERGLRVVIVACADHIDAQPLIRRFTNVISRQAMDRILRAVDPRCADRLRLYTYHRDIFQHRKITTVDGDFAWVSSSNLSDRSLVQGGDTELGVFVRDGGVVRAIRENSLELIKRYGVEVRRKRTHRAINGWLVRQLQRLMDTRLL